MPNESQRPRPTPSPNGGEPWVYVRRGAVERALTRFTATLAGGEFPGVVGLFGCRGIGKTVELNRLQQTLSNCGVTPILVTLHGTSLTLEARLIEKLDQCAVPDQPAADVLDIGYNAQQRSNDRSLNQAFQTLTQNGRLGAAAFLLDECDFLSADLFEQVFSQLLNDASCNNKAVGIVAAGSSRAFLRSLNAQSTFVGSVVEHAFLQRFSEEEGISYLKSMGAEAGYDWDPSELSVGASAAAGVPRSLGALAHDILAAVSDGQSVGAATLEAARRLRARRLALLDILTPDAHVVWRKLLSPDSELTFPAYFADALQAIQAGKRSALSQARSIEALDTLLAAGFLELELDGRLQMVD